MDKENKIEPAVSKAPLSQVKAEAQVYGLPNRRSRFGPIRILLILVGMFLALLGIFGLYLVIQLKSWGFNNFLGFAIELIMIAAGLGIIYINLNR